MHTIPRRHHADRMPAKPVRRSATERQRHIVCSICENECLVERTLAREHHRGDGYNNRKYDHELDERKAADGFAPYARLGQAHEDMCLSLVSLGSEPGRPALLPTLVRKREIRISLLTLSLGSEAADGFTPSA